MQQMVSLLQISLLAQYVSDTIMPIIRSSRVLYRWLLPVAFGAESRKPDTQPTALHQTNNLKTKAPNTTGSNHLYNNLELLMMGIMVSETCRASNKIYNKETICCIQLAFYFHIPYVSVSCMRVWILSTDFIEFVASVVFVT